MKYLQVLVIIYIMNKDATSIRSSLANADHRLLLFPWSEVLVIWLIELEHRNYLSRYLLQTNPSIYVDVQKT